MCSEAKTHFLLISRKDFSETLQILCCAVNIFWAKNQKLIDVNFTSAFQFHKCM